MLLHYSIMIGVDIQWMLAMSSSTVLQLLARKHKNYQWYPVVHLVTIVCVYQIKHTVAITFVLSLCLVQFVCNQDLICQLGSLINNILYMFFHLSVSPILPTIHIQSQRTPRTPHPSHLQAAVAAANSVT